MPELNPKTDGFSRPPLARTLARSILPGKRPILPLNLPKPKLGTPTPGPASVPGVSTAEPPPMPLMAIAPTGSNPFQDLPFRSPGDRIKADDFNKLSQSLKIVYDMHALSGALFGRNFGEAKLALASQQYDVYRVMSVFGTEIENMEDESLDNRKVIQVQPLSLGDRHVMVILTEAVETRRFAPNLLGLNYGEAAERLRAVLGEVTFPTRPMSASQLVGLSLKEAKQILST